MQASTPDYLQGRKGEQEMKKGGKTNKPTNKWIERERKKGGEGRGTQEKQTLSETRRRDKNEDL